ncbi:hypothetical protein E1211_27780 [Micromonospora sp. 15K316]|uniref:hypothetical protein n=1 Tax=Micromonospora sp. 15K316 TaxID=2530376 RepID=UPI001044D902|nr:hypothetical protein [Micromonospora sp. 15K316]TDC28487.1 hypothetical protein E1211_27780 [Micromonospora sp. 15K316]
MSSTRATADQPTGQANYQRTGVYPLADLTLFPGNARRGDPELILTSLRRNGQYRALVVRDEGDGQLTILAGNHTAQALERHGPGPCDYRPTVRGVNRPCGVCRNEPWELSARAEVIVCDDDTARRINLVDNRAADQGAYDNDALTELLSYLDGDYEGSGYAEADVEDLLRLVEPPDLDKLADEIGEPDDTDGWPVIRFPVPPHVAAAWRSHLDTHGGQEVAAFAALLDVDPETPAEQPWDPDLQAEAEPQ